MGGDRARGAGFAGLRRQRSLHLAGGWCPDRGMEPVGYHPDPGLLRDQDPLARLLRPERRQNADDNRYRVDRRQLYRELFFT